MYSSERIGSKFKRYDSQYYCQIKKKNLNKRKVTSCAVLEATRNNILRECVFLLNKESIRSF